MSRRWRMAYKLLLSEKRTAPIRCYGGCASRMVFWSFGPWDANVA